ncbi:MAG: hypothetical protein Q7V62_09395 [Actinomycetota bacterium]|nr:hypothetical protein [Actinomycetota bacterium]
MSQHPLNQRDILAVVQSFMPATGRDGAWRLWRLFPSEATAYQQQAKAADTAGRGLIDRVDGRRARVSSSFLQVLTWRCARPPSAGLRLLNAEMLEYGAWTYGVWTGRLVRTVQCLVDRMSRPDLDLFDVDNADIALWCIAQHTRERNNAEFGHWGDVVYQGVHRGICEIVYMHRAWAFESDSAYH